MSYEARCPSCGATVVFALGSTLLKVCEHCSVAVARKGADLAAYGRVAALIPTSSALKLGIEGRDEGRRRFTIVGRLQLDWGGGTWDEWCLGFDDDRWAWLAETQGKFFFMRQAPLPPVPAFGRIEPGQTVDLGEPGTFLVAEVREARFQSAAGELPFDAEPGSLLRYVDLSGPRCQLATLDYGAGEECEALYVGREFRLADLGIARGDLVPEEERRARAAGEALSCTQCGGPLELRAPDETKRVACPWCGSLLDATRGFAVLEALARPPVKPLVPLGSRGRLGDSEWSVIGFLERSVTVEGERYPWHEYLLHEPERGFRWLTESSGHWALVEPVGPGEVERGSQAARLRGERFKHFQSGRARVDHVLGELYWEVARGDEVDSEDYVAPPRMLSCERDRAEVTWSLGTYLEPEEVWTAFRLEGKPPAKRGVGACEPWRHGRALKESWGGALLFLALLVLVTLGFWVGSVKPVYTAHVAIPPGAAPGSPEAAHFTETFRVPARGHVMVRASAPVDNSWLYLDGALINEATGELRPFDLEVSYYHGSDSDGSWSEGGRRRARHIPGVTAGTYLLRLQPQWPAQPGTTPPEGYDLTVRAGVPRLPHFFLAALAILAWPALLTWRKLRFEYRRWSESDHPWAQSS